MEITTTDADGFDRLSQHADLAIVLISRADIEAMQVGSTVERLMLFSDDAEQVFRFAGRMVLQIEGYDADPRPLVQIPECVRFFRAVDAQWNYWLHFLLPLPDQLQLIVLMLTDVRVQERRGAMVGYAPRDPRQLRRVLDRQFDALDRLHAAFGVPGKLRTMIKQAVHAALGLPG